MSGRDVYHIFVTGREDAILACELFRNSTINTDMEYREHTSLTKDISTMNDRVCNRFIYNF